MPDEKSAQQMLEQAYSNLRLEPGDAQLDPTLDTYSAVELYRQIREVCRVHSKRDILIVFSRMILNEAVDLTGPEKNLVRAFMRQAQERVVAHGEEAEYMVESMYLSAIILLNLVLEHDKQSGFVSDWTLLQQEHEK